MKFKFKVYIKLISINIPANIAISLYAQSASEIDDIKTPSLSISSSNNCIVYLNFVLISQLLSDVFVTVVVLFASKNSIPIYLMPKGVFLNSNKPCLSKEFRSSFPKRENLISRL